MGLVSRYLERVVNPFRIPRDDSNAKVMLFLDYARDSFAALSAS